MERRAIVLVALIAALLTALSGCKRPEASFAYVDDQNRVVLYDLGAQRQIWTSRLKGPPEGSPAWSPDGKTLAYVCKDPDLGKWYVALLSVDSKKETLVELKDSPVAWGCFHIAATRVAYVRIQGKPPSHTPELVIYDTSSGVSTALVRGELGYSIVPEQWTDRGAIIYRYLGRAGADKRKLDTDGGKYEYPKGSPHSSMSSICHNRQGHPAGHRGRAEGPIGPSPRRIEPSMT